MKYTHLILCFLLLVIALPLSAQSNSISNEDLMSELGKMYNDENRLAIAFMLPSVIWEYIRQTEPQSWDEGTIAMALAFEKWEVFIVTEGVPSEDGEHVICLTFDDFMDGGALQTARGERLSPVDPQYYPEDLALAIEWFQQKLGMSDDESGLQFHFLVFPRANENGELNLNPLAPGTISLVYNETVLHQWTFPLPALVSQTGSIQQDK